MKKPFYETLVTVILTLSIEVPVAYTMASGFSNLNEHIILTKSGIR